MKLIRTVIDPQFPNDEQQKRSEIVKMDLPTREQLWHWFDSGTLTKLTFEMSPGYTVTIVNED